MPAATICRVTIQVDDIGIDLALPAAVPLATLMPTVLNVIGPRAGQPESVAAADWQLSRPGQAPLTSALTLSDNDVRDGELLMFTRTTCNIAAPVFRDPFEAVAASHACQDWTSGAARACGVAVALCMAVVAAALLIRDGLGAPEQLHAVTPMILGCALLVAAAIATRVYHDALAALALTLCATAFAAAAGFLVAPGEPAAPHILLASAVAAAASAVGMRVTGCGTTVLKGITVLAVMVAAAALACMLTRASAAATGAALAAAAVGLLTLAPRLSIAAARLPLSHAEEAGLVDKAAAAHEILTGLSCAFCAAAVVGAALAANARQVCDFAVAAVVAMTLLLRARSHADVVQIVAVLTAGICTVAMVLAQLAVRWPGYTNWAAIVAAVTAASGIGLGFTKSSVTSSPALDRAIDIVEYVALAALAPLACWVCGVYEAVRGLHLP